MSDQNNGIPPVEPLPQVPQPAVPPAAQQASPPQPVAPPPPPGYAPAGGGYPQAGAVPQYGTEPQYAGVPQYAPVPVRRSSVLSILSLVFGIVSIVGGPVLFIPFVGFFLGLWFPAASVVLGFIARKKEPHAKGMWLTGIILGFVALALAILSLVLWTTFAVNGGFNDDGSYNSGFNS